jgi:hypothetical protein
MSDLGPEEREIFLILVEQLEETWGTIRQVAQAHRALLEVLVAKGVLTQDEYTAALKERAARTAVDDALDPEEQARLRRLEKFKRLIRGYES